MSQYINMPVAKAAVQQEKISEFKRRLPTGLRVFGAVAAVLVLLYGIGGRLPHDAGAGQARQLHGHIVFREYVPQP